MFSMPFVNVLENGIYFKLHEDNSVELSVDFLSEMVRVGFFKIDYHKEKRILLADGEEINCELIDLTEVTKQKMFDVLSKIPSSDSKVRELKSYIEAFKYCGLPK